MMDSDDERDEEVPLLGNVTALSIVLTYRKTSPCPSRREMCTM